MATSSSAVSWRRICLLAATSIVTIWVGFGLISRDQALEFVRRSGFWGILAAVLLFGLSLVRWVRANRIGLVASTRSVRWVTVLLWAICVLIGLTIRPFGYRIVEDELVLVGTSGQMHREREVSYVDHGYDLGNGFVATDVRIDKRPLLFPFLVALLHDVSGYRVENAFVVNGVAFALVLALCGLLGRKMAGEWGGRLAMFAMFSVPLLLHQSSGAGFEVVNLACILGVILIAWLYAESPSDEGLAVFVLAAVLLAQVRYESGLFLVFVAVVVGLVAWREQRIRIPGIVIVSPFLLVHHLWLLRIFESGRQWQLFGQSGATHVFGFGFFARNVGHALNFYLTSDGSQASSPLVFVVGVIGLCFFALVVRREWSRWWRGDFGWIALSVMLAGVGAHLLLMLMYFWGQFDDVAVQRLSLPSYVLWTLAPLGLASLFRKSDLWLRWVSAIFATYVVTFTLPVVSAGKYASRNAGALRAEWIDHFAKANANSHCLAVDNLTPLVWLGREVPAVEIREVRLDPGRLARHFRLGSFEKVFVSQAFFRHPVTGSWTRVPEDDLGVGVELETLAEFQLSPVKKQRISRIVAIDPTKPTPPWPKDLPPGRPIWNLDRGKAFLEAWTKTLP